MIEITINHTVAFENMLQAAPVFLCPPSIEINPFKKSYEFSPIKYFDNWSKRTTNATTTQKVTTNLTLTLIFFIKNNYTFSKTFVNKLWVDCSVVASITIINLAQHIIHANTKQFHNEHKFVNSRLRHPSQHLSTNFSLTPTTSASSAFVMPRSFINPFNLFPNVIATVLFFIMFSPPKN